MKKIFKFSDPKKEDARVVEGIKHEIRKYIKREKKKKLADAKLTYWDFDCKIGQSQSGAEVVAFDALIKAIDTIHATGAKECYVEIMAKVVEKPLKQESLEDIEE